MLHLCGDRDFDGLRGRVTRADYRLLPFVDDYGAALGAADVVVSRAGGSVWEIAAAGKPAILVPYPEATADHQTKNAGYFARAGGAIVVADADAHEAVPRLVAELLADEPRPLSGWLRRCSRRRGRTQQRKLRMSSSPSQPLAGRRLWLAGIGGAGMSAYALLARAWGADVSGWDRVETPYLAHLDGVAVEIAPEPPSPPAGAEVYVSTAFAGVVEGRPRAELLAELVSLRRAIVVAGAHGKTTTCAMIAFCLAQLGLDPAFLIGGEIPQLGGNAGAGGGWLVVEGDESDRSVAALRPEIAVLLNVDLDHHTTFGSRAEVAELFEQWLAHVPQVVRGDELEPVDLELAVPGEHNRRNAAAALAALELAGVARADAERVIVEFRGAGRRLEEKGEAGGVRVLDSYAHHPAELAADLAAVRDGGRVVALFQPHLYSRTRYLAHEFAVALAGADAVCVTEIYPAREEAIPGVTGRLIVDELASVRPGMRLGWAPTVEDSVRVVAGWARAGDTVVTLGAGDVDRAGALLLEVLA